MTDTPNEREGDGPWAKLRRRKVVQWGIAYAAGAWALLQVVGFAADAFHWPDVVKQIAMLALGVGLPIALTLAWYHGDRGEQRVTRAELAILTLLVLVGGGLFWRYQNASDAPASAATAAKPEPAAPSPAAAAAPNDKSIAVLPFVDMSAQHDQEYMSDGIAEELLDLLTKIPDLKVIARTSSFAFKGKEMEIAEIAQKLNVAHVLEGSVRKSGNKIRITAQLVRASDSMHLWSETYDRPLDDIFAVQDEIAGAVVAELKIKLLGAVPKTRVTDPKAYALFLQAREFLRQGSEAAFQQAITLYQQALAIDAAYTAAWAGLADVYSGQVINGLRLPDEGIRLAREATEKELALDPEYAEAYDMLGWIALFYDRDLAAAARHLDHALALEPANSEVIGTASALARRLGRLDQAIALAKYQVALDPVYVDGHENLGSAYRYAGRLDEAIAEFRTELSLSPGVLTAHSLIGEVLLQKGDASAALAEVRQEPNEQYRLCVLSMAYHALGQRAESDAALAELIRKYEKTSAYSIAIALAYRGEADRAFEWLDKAVQYHDPSMATIAGYPMLATLHTDPRWLPLLRKLGMAPEQLAAIKFDVTLPK